MIRLSQKPLRAVSVARIEELVEQLPTSVPRVREGETERPRVGLVGAAVASHPDFEEICRRLREKGWEITASAIEIDKVTDGILDLLSRSQKTLTLAPERGIEAERFRLGKRISDEHLLDVARRAGELRMPRLKMYFVCGIISPAFYGADTDRPGVEIRLPDWLRDAAPAAGPRIMRKRTSGVELLGQLWEERIFEHEAEAVGRLVERIAEVYRPEGEFGTIGVTCSPFIPKPHTPWASWPMPSERGLKTLDRMLKKRLGHIPRARYRPFSSWEALLQGLLSQGGQSLAPFLLEASRHPEDRKRLVRQAIESGLVRIHERRWQIEPSPWSFVRL